MLHAALERAKEAGKKERAVCKLREQFGLLEQINSDLTYAVAVSLASVYQAAQLYTEALNSFTQIVRSKQFPQVHTITSTCLKECSNMHDWTVLLTVTSLHASRSMATACRSKQPKPPGNVCAATISLVQQPSTKVV